VLLFGLAYATPASADGPGRKFNCSPMKRLCPLIAKPPNSSSIFRDLGDRKHQNPISSGPLAELASLPRIFGTLRRRRSPRAYPRLPVQPGTGRWLVRMHEIWCAGLTRRCCSIGADGNRFLPGTKNPLGRSSPWIYFFHSSGFQRDARAISKDPYSLDTCRRTGSRDGGALYAWLGDHWPRQPLRSVISLSFDIQGQEQPTPWIEAGSCVLDVKRAHFRVAQGFCRQ